MANKKDVAQVYDSQSIEEQKQSYDHWAADYEADLCAMGYRIPLMIAAVFVRYVPTDTSPILDAGCGGGMQAEPLVMLGYENITGIDLSEKMLEVAQSKRIYSKLETATLGEALDFPDNHFAAIISSGTITPQHAPPNSFDELIRIAKPGAPIIFSMRDDAQQEPEYPAMLDQLENTGRWKQLFKGDHFQSMPYAEPDITHRIYVYKVL